MHEDGIERKRAFLLTTPQKIENNLNLVDDLLLKEIKYEEMLGFSARLAQFSLGLVQDPRSAYHSG